MTEIYEWGNEWLNKVEIQHAILFDSIEKTIVNGKEYYRAPVQDTKGSFYFTKNKADELQVTFIRVWKDINSPSSNAHIEFADYTNQKFYIISYKYNKADSIYIANSLFYFDKVFGKKSQPTRKTNSIFIPNLSIPSSGDPLLCPNVNGSSKSLWGWLSDLWGGLQSFFSDLFSGFASDSNTSDGIIDYGGFNLQWYTSSGITYYNEGTSIAPIWNYASNTSTGPALYDPNNPFSNPDKPLVASDDPLLVLNNGIEITQIPAPTTPGVLMAATNPRHGSNAEDMLHETTGNTTDILPSVLGLTDNDLFAKMTNLLHSFSVYGTPNLIPTTDLFIQRFKSNLGGSYSTPDLNNAVLNNSHFKDFLTKFGDILNKKLLVAGNNINNIGYFTIDQQIRPIFNGFRNKFTGLQILINDTEQTEVYLNNFYIDASGNWQADVTIKIHDHFGLDKNDALKYQNWHSGFAAWWVLQHKRNYLPFETLIILNYRFHQNAQP